MNNDFAYIHEIWTREQDFFGRATPLSLVEKYGSPLYVYNENMLRSRCREMKRLIDYPAFAVNYSAKANTNPAILKIIREEGLYVDAMSPGEIFLELKAGFRPEDILFICNNVSDEEIRYAVDAGILVSVDSISQLERLGRLNRGGRVAVRINPGIGAGHHEKVVTAGTNTKFGVDPRFAGELRAALGRHDLRLAGLNQHIGSLFMTGDEYIEAARFLFSFAEDFPEIEFLDFGGGFGIPYHKENGEKRLDLSHVGKRLQKAVEEWVEKTGRRITIKIEPGRYTVAECGLLLGTVHALKVNGGRSYAGTDIGFNVLIRRAMYDAHHDIEVYSDTPRESAPMAQVTVVGNICETGDIIAKDRMLPPLMEGDILGILDAGAYGMVMASNYNCRLRPAEVLITAGGDDVLIRSRDTLEDLARHYPG
ncbi:MAG: diaminopimelate decarboxylase [Spirochaetes bacterium]|nr:diaminopimelate decarboxylase [Spirochaetota bacterium]